MKIWIRKGVLLLLLGVGSAFDIKYKKVPVWLLALGSIMAVLCSNSWEEKNIGMAVLSLLPGMGMIAVSYLTDESLGYADGGMILILGIWKGFLGCLVILCMSLFILSFIGIILMLSKKAHRKTKIPFVPFLFIAECVTLFISSYDML